MTTLFQIGEAMREHDGEHAPGSETAQLQSLVESCYERFDMSPFDDAARDLVLEGEDNEDFAAYWLAVAKHDWATASKLGEVPDEWREDYAE